MAKFIGVVVLCVVLSLLESSSGARYRRDTWQGEWDLWFKIPSVEVKSQFEKQVTGKGIVMILAGSDDTGYAYRAEYKDLNRIKAIATSLNIVFEDEIPLKIDAVWEAYFGIDTETLKKSFEDRVKQKGYKMEFKEEHTYPDGSKQYAYIITIPDLTPVNDIAKSLHIFVGSHTFLTRL